MPPSRQLIPLPTLLKFWWLWSALWLNFFAVKEQGKIYLLDALVSPSAVFGTALKSVVRKFREAKVQTVVFERYIPHRSRVPPNPPLTPWLVQAGGRVRKRVWLLTTQSLQKSGRDLRDVIFENSYVRVQKEKSENYFSILYLLRPTAPVGLCLCWYGESGDSI